MSYEGIPSSKKEIPAGGRGHRSIEDERHQRSAVARIVNTADTVRRKAHPLSRVVQPSSQPAPPAWLLPGFMAVGLTVIAGQQGIGKTTTLLPLAAGVAGIHEAGWPLAWKHWRHVVYITEDVLQAQRILCGLAGHLGTTPEEIGERVHLVEAQRMSATHIVAVAGDYMERFVRDDAGVRLPPLVVLDTQAATIALESENDNAEASRAVAALKQQFGGMPVWVVAHVARANMNRSDVQALGARGASAWEADANATAFLVKDGLEETAARWLALGKCRFEPRWRELRLESHSRSVEAVDAWGERETVLLRWAIARPEPDGRQQVRAAAAEAERKRADGDLQEAVLVAVEQAWRDGNPLNRTGVRAQVRRKASEVVTCIELLLHEQWLLEVPVPREQRTHPRRTEFLVALTPAEHDDVRMGAAVPAEKLAIPASWRRQVSIVPTAGAAVPKK